MPTLCHYCNTVKDDTRFGICPGCLASHTKNQTKLCSGCKILQKWGDFPKDNRLFGLAPRCRTCKSRYDSQKIQRREVFLKAMLRYCCKQNNRRICRGRRDLEFTWTYEQMCRKLEKQNDKCALSGLLMSFKPHSDWKCSPERIDNNKGYIDENVIFICLEFQLGHSLQASIELVDRICRIETAPHPRLSEILAGDFKEEKFISHCSLGKHKCKECEAKWNTHYHNTVRGRMAALAGSTKRHTKYRNLKGKGHSLSESDLKHNLEMLQNQQGLCQLTGHHLGFETGKWNCASIDRANVNLGYTKGGNMSLVMQCMNTLDYSSIKSLANEPKEGSGGWTKAKVELLRRHHQDREIKV